MKRVQWLSLAVAALAGCSVTVATGPEGLLLALGGDQPSGTFTTDAVAYTARPVEQQPWPGTTIYGFTVVTRYTNPTRDPIYLWNCFPDSRPPMYSVVAAGRRTPEGIAYNAPRACVGHDRPIRVDPGASRVDTLQLRGPNGFDGATNEPIDPIVEGRFQLRFLAQRCRTEGDCPIRDESLTLSNEFEVRTAR